MDVKKLSSRYLVRRLSENDIDSILELCLGNPMFYHYCPPAVTKESIARDMAALPPRTTYDDKYYLGIYDGDDLIAVMDLILRYPNAETAFIGFFMVSAAHQGCGLGSFLVGEILACLADNGFGFTRLGYVKGNPQARAFWLKNGFAETGVEAKTEAYTMVVLQRPNRC